MLTLGGLHRGSEHDPKKTVTVSETDQDHHLASSRGPAPVLDSMPPTAVLPKQLANREKKRTGSESKNAMPPRLWQSTTTPSRNVDANGGRRTRKSRVYEV